MTQRILPYNFRSVGPPEQAQVQGDFDEVGKRGAIAFGLSSTPAQITSDQDDYVFTGTFLRLSTDASRTITGFAGGTDGKQIYVVNVGSNDLILADEDAASSAENRTISGHGVDITLDPDESAHLWYDLTSLRRRILGTNPSIWS